MSQKDYIKIVSEEIYNQLGYGLSEITYEKAYQAELSEVFRNVQTEYHIQEYYTTMNGKKIQIGDLRIDILIDNEIIIELKTLESSLMKKKDIKITKEYKQLKRYMKLMNISKGFLINIFNGGVDLFEIDDSIPPEII